MRQGLKFELVLYRGHSQPFCGFCKDVEVTIGELKTRYPIFMIKSEDNNLMLGQSFWNFAQFS